MTSDIPMILIANAIDTHVNFYSLKSNMNENHIITPDDTENFLKKYFNGELIPTSRRKHDLPDEVYSVDEIEKNRRLVNENDDIEDDSHEDMWWNPDDEIWETEDFEDEHDQL